MCQVPNFNYSNPLLKHSCSPFPKATTSILFYQREKPADLPHEEKNAQIKKLACFFQYGFASPLQSDFQLSTDIEGNVTEKKRSFNKAGICNQFLPGMKHPTFQDSTRYICIKYLCDRNEQKNNRASLQISSYKT